MSEPDISVPEHQKLPDNPTIVVIDDDKENADLYSYRLDKEYVVHTAYGGKQGLDMVNTDTDIVLLDRRMPKMTGDEVLEEIRSLGYTCQVVMVTAIDPTADIVGMEFDEYINKPVGGETELRVIKEQLKIRRLNQVTKKLIATESKLEIIKDNAESEVDVERNDEYVTLKETAADLEEVKAAIEADVGSA